MRPLKSAIASRQSWPTNATAKSNRFAHRARSQTARAGCLSDSRETPLRVGSLGSEQVVVDHRILGPTRALLLAIVKAVTYLVGIVRMIEAEKAGEDFLSRLLADGEADAMLRVPEVVFQVKVRPAIRLSDGMPKFGVEIAESPNVYASFGGGVKEVVGLR